MITYDAFIRLGGSEQLDLLGEQAIFLTEQTGPLGCYQLFYALGEFFVHLCLMSIPVARIHVTAFTAKDPTFDVLIASIPLELAPYERTS